MAIEYIREVWRGRNVHEDDKARTYIRTFLVKSTIPNEDPNTVRTAAGLPLLFSVYPTDGSALLTAREAKQSEDPEWWEATCNYTTDFSSHDQQASELGPLAQPPKVSWATEDVEEAVQEDIAGAPVVNSVDDPFDPPLTIEKSRPVLRVSGNAATFDQVEFDIRCNGVNNAVWYGFPKYTVKFDDYSAAQEWDEKTLTFYWKIDLVFKINKKTWDAKLLDQGFRAFDPVTGGTYSVLDDNGKPVTNPVLLDANGLELGTVTSTPHFIAFQTHERIDMNNVYNENLLP
jgi:hypothetical protein